MSAKRAVTEDGEEARAELRDGRRVLLRQLHASDRDQMLHAFERLSAVSRYRRFLGVQSELSPAQLDYLTRLDHHDHEALVALDPDTGDGVGVARYVRLPDDPDAAEFAVTVVDEWQGVGLGTLLAERLADRARGEGVRRVTGLVLAENEPMLDILGRLGPERSRTAHEGTVELVVDIADSRA